MKRQPGIYDGVPDSEYHGDHDQVSSSVIRVMGRDGGPAKYKWSLDHPRPYNPNFEFGHVAHAIILPNNPAVDQITVMDYPDFRTKTAREERDNAVAEGLYPMLADDAEVFEAMREAVYQDGDAKRLLSQPGKCEQSVYWTDPTTGMDCKARPDYLPEANPSKDLIIIDYKTAEDASPDGFSKAAAQFGYHQQAEWYCRGLQAIGYHPNPQMAFIVQEKKPPYEVGTYIFTFTDLVIARELNNRGLDTYKRCLETDTWPGYSRRLLEISTPEWYIRRMEQELGLK